MMRRFRNTNAVINPLNDAQMAMLVRANQLAMSITANNVANASTEGYRRQEAIFATVNPAMGDGVSRAPSRLLMTFGWPASITATTEFVVPRSMPITLAIVNPS